MSNTLKQQQQHKRSLPHSASTDNFADERGLDTSETFEQDNSSSEAVDDPKARSKAAIENDSVVVHQAELLTFACLLYSAAGLGVAVSLLTKEEAENDFADAVDIFGQMLIDATEEKLQKSYQLLKTLSASFTSIAAQGDYPFVTISDFAFRTEQTLLATQATSLAWCPLVHSNQVQEWNTYSEQHMGWASVSEGGSLPWTPLNSSGASFQDILAPQWQFAPLLGNRANENRFESGAFVEAVGIIMQTKNEQMTRTSFERHYNTPTMSLLVPSYVHRAETQELVAIFELRLNWETLFDGILPTTSGPLLVEMSDKCGSKFIYDVRPGSATFVRAGSIFRNLFEDSYVDAVLSNFTPGNNGCRQTMTVFPTLEFREGYDNKDSHVYTALVVVVFFFMIMAFLCYAWTVRSRQKIVTTKIEKTSAIVSSIFPENVQDRLYSQAEANGKRVQGPTKSMLKNWALTIHNHDKSPLGKPIADLFTDCTIMFGDIVGFTAWSSTREPSQVFTLLEHIYHRFDEIASRRKVFKVETVSDCYVAVCGLPEARKDHAVVMARFAINCLNGFNGMVQELVLELGPDTEDLSIRIGMHSGPVTAGVLRGERARFQLFGDTVNTTARMESTGRPNSIQISQETANHLFQAGKGQWLKAREDAVIAKGKGEMKTFWLAMGTEPESAPERTSEASPSLRASGSESNEVVGLTVNPMAKMNLETAREKKHMRLVMWNIDVLSRSLAQIILRRKATGVNADSLEKMRKLESTVGANKSALDEVKEVVELPAFQGKISNVEEDTVGLPEPVREQLVSYIQALASMYNDNPFHNFEHASHVTMSVTKLLSRIIAPDSEQASCSEASLHDHTYGITSDPLTQFSVILSALIHDADHPGVPNNQLIKEGDEMAKVYREKSVAEQNSIDLAWGLLMDGNYEDLRRAIYVNETELLRFRQLIVNVVLATDIMDKELKALRNKRWELAFSEGHLESNATTNRKATIVLEHLIQASDVAHTMQHWHIYRKWNMRLFIEVYKAWALGRGAGADPSETWYQGEMGFLDFYVIPLAKKLKDCGVFGVSSDEYLNYAMMNRAEWERRGQSIVAENLEMANQELQKFCKEGNSQLRG